MSKVFSILCFPLSIVIYLYKGGPAVPGLIDYNFIKFRESVGKVFEVRNRIHQQVTIKQENTVQLDVVSQFASYLQEMGQLRGATLPGTSVPLNTVKHLKLEN